MNVIDIVSPSLPALLRHDRRPRDDTAPPDAAHRRRADRRREAGLLHALPVDADRPEHRLAALPRRPRRARASSSSIPASSSPARSARSAWCARCSASPCCRSHGAGLMLVLLGAALLVIDAHVTSHGALTLSGLVAMAIGLTTLFHDSGTPYHMNVWVVVTVTALIGGFWAFAVGKSVAARRRAGHRRAGADRRPRGRRPRRRQRLRPRRALARPIGGAAPRRRPRGGRCARRLDARRA